MLVCLRRAALTTAALLVACAASPLGALRAPNPPSNTSFLSTTNFTFAPADRWSPRKIAGGATAQLSKWGSALAVVSSAVTALAPPFPKRLGLVYGTGSSNGFLRVTVNGVVLGVVDTYNETTAYTSEYIVELAPNVNKLPNQPLWVLVAEATGAWRSGSKDSYVEIVGLNVYY